VDDICSVPWTEECFFLQEAVDGSTFEEKKRAMIDAKKKKEPLSMGRCRNVAKSLEVWSSITLSSVQNLKEATSSRY